MRSFFHIRRARKPFDPSRRCTYCGTPYVNHPNADGRHEDIKHKDKTQMGKNRDKYGDTNETFERANRMLRRRNDRRNKQGDRMAFLDSVIVREVRETKPSNSYSPNPANN